MTQGTGPRSLLDIILIDIVRNQTRVDSSARNINTVSDEITSECGAGERNDTAVH